MERKEKIYAYMSSDSYIPLTFEELKLMLDVPDSDADELFKLLNELISEGKIFLSKKRRFAVTEKNKMFSGILRCSARKPCGFVLCDGQEDIYIPHDQMSGALDSDRVLVRLTSGKRSKREGCVCSVLERGNHLLSAVMTDDFTARCDNPRIPYNIRLTEVLDAAPGDRVIIELTNYLPGGALEGAVTSVLGSGRDLKTLTGALIFETGIKSEFEPETLAQAISVPCEVSAADCKGRCDLTDEIIFTIDGDDAKDFDDAVSLKHLDNGNFELGVHIADVTHYVKPDSPLDREAAKRGTSVYLADRVIPMLPFELSNGICSLNPHVLRLTLSVIMEIDRNGAVIKNKILKSVIRSCERMTYDNVAKILNGDRVLCEKYAHIVPVLQDMHRLAKLLNSKRQERGSISFDFPESRVILDTEGRPTGVVKLVRNDAHRLIEEFMLIANETVAEFAFWADIPFVYRVHEQPEIEKTDNFRKFIGNFGLCIKGAEVHPKDMQQILDKIKDTDIETLIASHMLRSLMKAEYKPECRGHFGLAAKYYCHFTSPIRRYPDLMIHRILKDFLVGKDISLYSGQVGDVSARSSKAEQTAELCQRNVEDLFKAAYMSDFIGCEFKATVSSVTNFGMFAELDNSIEGLIRLETIDGDYYEFDENTRMLTGRRHGKTYRIGDTVQIEVVRADTLSRQIDFVLKGSRKKPKKSHHTAANRKSDPGNHNRRKNHKRGRKNGQI